MKAGSTALRDVYLHVMNDVIALSSRERTNNRRRNLPLHHKGEREEGHPVNYDCRVKHDVTSGTAERVVSSNSLRIKLQRKKSNGEKQIATHPKTHAPYTVFWTQKFSPEVEMMNFMSTHTTK